MLVTLARFFDPWEAHVVRARLEAEGIQATVAYANHAIVNWPMSLALGGTAVQVPAASLERSRGLLADYAAGNLEEALNEEIGSQGEHCPRCGSNDFKRTMPWCERLRAIVIVLVFAPYPTSRTRFICRDCDFRWDWGEH